MARLALCASWFIAAAAVEVVLDHRAELRPEEETQKLRPVLRKHRPDATPGIKLHRIRRTELEALKAPAVRIRRSDLQDDVKPRLALHDEAAAKKASNLSAVSDGDTRQNATVHLDSGYITFPHVDCTQGMERSATSQCPDVKTGSACETFYFVDFSAANHSYKVCRLVDSDCVWAGDFCDTARMQASDTQRDTRVVTE
eukprot:CAMPEP_0197662068 /NCGR_PEP_ID=MMETSP1338-20131121/52041_1 /TAXON_ID=43686 ORGANISM="Pelagodinium beii, Strain RCC1491" /NCGR_SAMPLE_ID=MMETSP1338 /ASSEMBLY_ACC=CAM_ASM_000754 /LENGTH=198 /DNA_ID=CAMNT_0043239765 /DNA_START=60 /DNA_END=656 /DNA_ORIENTATION=-